MNSSPDQKSEDENSVEPEWIVLNPDIILPDCKNSPPRNSVKLWALTLDSRSITCQLLNDNDQWSLLVPPELVDSAYIELKTFEQQNRNWPPQLPPQNPAVVSLLGTLSVLLVLASFYNISHLSPDTLTNVPLWYEIGNADALCIRKGELWRTVTALTLHADAAHLLGNCAIGGVFAFLLCRQVGSGLGWILILFSGVLGNLFNALLQQSGHHSIGASTAVFGTVGILGAIGQLRYRNYLRKRWMLPVAGALTLLTVLGSEGKNTDLGAHLFGLLAGIMIGLITESVIVRRGIPGQFMNLLLALMSIAIVFGGWWWGI